MPTEQAQQFADYHNLLFMETSSKFGVNVEDAFKEVALKVYELLENGKFRMQEGWEGIKMGLDSAQTRQRLPGGLQTSGTSAKGDGGARRGCC